MPILRVLVPFIFLGLFHAPLQGASCEGALAQVDPTPALSGWGMSVQNHRFIPEKAAGITAGNIDRLQVKWVFALPDTEAPRSQPLLTPDTVVIGDEPGTVYALDRETGCEKWRFNAGSMVRTALRQIEYEGEQLVSFGTFDGELFVLSLRTGELRWRRRVDDHPKAMISGSQVDHAGVIYQPVSSWELFWAVNPFYACCTFRSSVVALSVDTGEILWQAYTIEQQPDVVKSRWLLPDHLGPSGAPVWSQPTLDVKRQRIYVGTGENYSSPATDTSDAILAFDMKTGEMIWKQQFVGGDAWNVSCAVPGHINCPSENGDDLDFGAPPILIEVSGRDYILAGQKSGQLFALDPDNGGALLWSKRAGAGNKGGGIHIGMAVDPLRGALYVPISDRPVGFLGDSYVGDPNPSIQAFDIPSGEQLWITEAPGDCLAEGREPKAIDGCFRGFSAPVTATENIVFAPTLDGHIRAFDARNGKQLWNFNSYREYPAVNGGTAQGGAIDIGGVYLDRGQLFISSGYGLVGQIPGNAFMAFELARQTDGSP